MKKHNYLFYLAIVAFFSALVSCNQKTNQGASSPDDLTRMNKEFAKAINSKDAAAAANLYAENARILPPNEPVVSGKIEIQKYWQGAIDAGVSDVTVTTITTGSTGDLGYEEGKYHLNIRLKDGTVIPENGKYLEILKKDSTGTWKSIYGMWSVDTTAAPAK